MKFDVSLHHLIFALFVLTLSFSTLADDKSRQVSIEVGDSVKIGRSSGTVVNPNSSVVKIREANGDLIAFGKSIGISKVRVGNANYEISVVGRSVLKQTQSLKNIISKMRGVKYRIRDGRLLLTGRLLRFSDWEIIYSTAQEDNIDYIAALEMSDAFRTQILNRAASCLKDYGLPSVRFSKSGELRAFIPKQYAAQLDTFRKSLRPFGIEALIVNSGIGIEPVVSVKILVTEVRKKFFQRLGVKWATEFQAQLIPKPNAEGSTLPIALEAVEDQGYGRILAEPRILCRSGKEAQFLAGGEVPIRVKGFRDSRIDWKKYGVLLKVAPLADWSGRMSIGVTTEVSDIDTSQMIDGLPGFKVNRIESHFDLESSRTIILSGLIKNDEGNSSSGLPWLSRIPILGSLFSSRDFLNNSSELVIAVTPSIATQE